MAAQRSRHITRSEIQKILYALLALASSPLVYYPWLWVHLPPKFSVELTGMQGLDTAAAAASLSTVVFNITLHASNKRGRVACYRHGEAVVRYSGFTLAWGRTRAFCVGAKQDTRDVPVVAWADGVGLPKPIRERMAAAERGAGTVELEVNVKLFAEGHHSGAEPTWMWCTVPTTARAEPSDATPCSVFRSKIWAADFAPYWMLV